MTTKKKATKKKAPAKKKPARDPAQVAAENKREENAKHGKTLVRHDNASAGAMKRLMRRWECSGPEALRLAAIEADARGNR